MASLVSRNASYVCRACKSRQASTALLQQFSPHAKSQMNLCQPTRTQRRAASTRLPSSGSHGASPKISSASKSPRVPISPSAPKPAPVAPKTTSDVPINPEDVRGTLRDIQNEINAVCASNSLPEEAKVLEILDRAYQFANLLVFGQTTAPEEEIQTPAEGEVSDTDLVSDLDESLSNSTRSPSSSASPSNRANSLPLSYRERSAETLCDALYTLLKDPKIHISEPLLSTYVRIICQLGNPEYLPEIFFLYANKPRPRRGTGPIQYDTPSPGSSKSAIPQDLSDVALDTAILQRDLALAVAIIDTTVGTRAFRRHKLLTRASLPLGVVASTPLVAYAAADWVAHWQSSLDPAMAKTVTLLGSAAYIGTLTTIGFVAVTTWNDHHERVRWSEGTPLRHRWTREEERLYFDRIAMAWGFQRKRRRGEEMGGLWEELRDECGVRGLVLDKTDLLPGMQ